MIDHRVRVENSSLFCYSRNQYSVPPEYIGQNVTLQIHDDYIHVYSNTKLIALHRISKKRINYQVEHYEALARRTHAFAEANIEDRARENLKAMGAIYE